MCMKIKKMKCITIVVMVCVGLIIFSRYENKHLVVSNYSVKSEKFAEGLDGFKIVQISDLHNARFGKENKRLLDLIDNQNPDIIVVTGDLVDSNHANINTALKFAEDMTTICQVYYVTGNHEYWLSKDDLNDLLTGLRERGVTILDNESVKIAKDGASFCLVGLDDNNLMDGTLGNLLRDNEAIFSLVLAHEPQCIQSYANAKADLVLSGHAHGGQFRFPFIGGVVAPNQGFNPSYTEGEYIVDTTTMIVSRGLGNSIIPVRLFNDPEIVCVVLNSK